MATKKKTAPRKISRKPSPPPGVDANLLADLMGWAKTAGADSAEAFYIRGESISVAQRLGKREKLEGSEGRDLRLRVFIGQRSASVSSTDFAPKALRTLVERAVGMDSNIVTASLKAVTCAANRARRHLDGGPA